MYKTYRGALTAAERQHRPKRLTAGRLPGAPAWSAAPMSTAWEIRVCSVVRGPHAFGPRGCTAKSLVLYSNETRF